MKVIHVLKQVAMNDRGLIVRGVMTISVIFAVVFIWLFMMRESRQHLQERLGSGSFTLPSLEAISSSEIMPLIMTPFTTFATLNKKVLEGKLRSEDGRKMKRQWHNEDLRGMRKCTNSFNEAILGWGEGEENECWNAARADYVDQWREGREVNKLCEPEALSAIHCHDSPPTSLELDVAFVGARGNKRVKPTRFCEFNNAMMNFKKMREEEGKRSFERVFEYVMWLRCPREHRHQHLLSRHH